MAKQDLKFDDALLMRTAREMLAKKLAETVKEVAKAGEWEIPTATQEEPEPEKIIRRMFAKYAYGNVPEWFAAAVSATSYVLSVDKGKGIECVSVLHTAAERAPAEIRMTAQTKLLMVCQETGMIGGFGVLPGADLLVTH